MATRMIFNIAIIGIAPQLQGLISSNDQLNLCQSDHFKVLRSYTNYVALPESSTRACTFRHVEYLLQLTIVTITDRDPSLNAVYLQRPGKRYSKPSNVL